MKKHYTNIAIYNNTANISSVFRPTITLFNKGMHLVNSLTFNTFLI